MLPYNKKLVKNAQTLRKNMTAEEKELWYNFLKKLPFPVKRQKNIGNFIVDFYIPKFKLVIELDGSQHNEKENRYEDEKRDEYMRSNGLKVLRFPNQMITEHFNDACRKIQDQLI